MAAITSGLIVAGTAVYGAAQQKKAGSKAAKAIEAGKVDPDLVAAQTRDQSLTNIRESLAAEQEFTPENAALRRGATEALLPLIGDQSGAEQVSAVDAEIEAGGAAEESGLLTESIAEARRQLSLGGNLDSATRNEVARRSIARGGNTGAARFLLPRDLGLRSMDVATDRLERGGRFGQIDQSRNQQTFDNLGRLRQLREQLSAGRQGRATQLASFGQNLATPNIGLSPGEYSGLFVQNQNINAQAAGQRAKNTGTNAQNYGEAINTSVGALTPLFTKK
jgi:hypothetical protein